MGLFMNLIVLFEDDFISDNRVRLQGRRLNHVASVHNASAGDELRVGLLGGKIGKGLVGSINQDFLEMEVDIYDNPPAPLPVTLLLALPRPRVLKRILFSVSSMGVKKIILINSYRVEKSYWGSPVLSKENYDQYLIGGLEQARDTTLPEIIMRPLFKPFVEDQLPDIVKDITAFVAHPIAKKKFPCGIKGDVCLVVGPEGGFIPYEIEKLKECGVDAVSLGERILSVETAVPVLLSKLF